jgi:hypothetical protein
MSVLLVMYPAIWPDVTKAPREATLTIDPFGRLRIVGKLALADCITPYKIAAII